MSTHRARLGAPVLPASLLRPACVVAGIATLAFATLAVRYAGSAAPGRLDFTVESLIAAMVDRSDWPSKLIAFGGPAAVVTLALLLCVLAFVLDRRRLALLAVVGPGVTGVATVVLKPLVGRLIGGDNLAFPSGHAGAVTALGLVAALLLVSVLWLEGPLAVAILTGGALVPGTTMAVALTIRRWHYPTDTLGGICLATGLVLSAALLIERIAEGRPRVPDRHS